MAGSQQGQQRGADRKRRMTDDGYDLKYHGYRPRHRDVKAEEARRLRRRVAADVAEERKVSVLEAIERAKSRKLVAPKTGPYDEVFYKGTKWLDSYG